MLRWRKVGTIVRREYSSRVKTKAFWIATAIVPLLMVVFTVAPALLVSRTGGHYKVEVVTGDEGLFTEMSAVLKASDRATSEPGTQVVELVRVEPAADAGAQRTELKRRMVAKETAAALILPAGASSKAEYLSTNVSNFRLSEKVQKAADEALLHNRLRAEGLGAEVIAGVSRPLDVAIVRVTQDLAENKDEGAMGSFLAGYCLTFLLFMTVVFYGYFVMRGVLEEKSSRIVELMVGSVRPTELMLGKIFGVGAVGLTQYAIWLVAGMNLAVPGLLAGAAAAGAAPLVSPGLLFAFVLFFVLGYFLYSAVYAAVGAAFNTEEEAQQMQTVLSTFLALPIVLVWPVMTNPDSTMSVVLSLVPLFSPVLFFVRMTVQPPPAWQLVLCLGLLVGTILLVARLAAAIYKVGILMYGKRPTIREVLGWVRSA